MSEKLYEAFEVCLQAIQTGADIESVLAPYPEMSDELRPVLEASVQAQSLTAGSIPEGAMQRGRTRVLQHAAEMRVSTQNVRRTIFLYPRLAISLVSALIFLFSGTGLVRASSGALPGDRLYPLKITWEGMRLLLAFSSEGRVELEDEFTQKRLYEINVLLDEGRYVTIAFAGVVTEQVGNRWVVSGIPVQIMPDSKLPLEAVTIGATIMLEGRTNAQGFVEADRVEILQPGFSLPASKPTEVFDPKGGNQNGNAIKDQNDNGDHDEIERETLKNDNDDSDKEDTEDKENNNSSDNEDNRDSNKGPGGSNVNDNDSKNNNDNSNDNDSGGDDDNDKRDEDD